MTLIDANAIHNATSPPVKGFLSPIQAQNIILRLLILCTDPVTPETLRILARFFTPTDYTDLVEERTVISRCGYPVCSNNLIDTHGKTRNPSTATVVHWQHSYCQISCYQSSEFYKEQLSGEPLVTRKNVCSTPFGEMAYEQQIMLLPDIKEKAALYNMSVTEVIANEISSAKNLVEKLDNLDIERPGNTVVIEKNVD